MPVGAGQSAGAITPIPLGLFTMPDRPRQKYPGLLVRAPYVVCAYLVVMPGVTLLFDTGIVGDEDAVAAYSPRFFPLEDQLQLRGVERSDVDVVVNCHLHADHAGGNHLFPGTPILVRPEELRASREIDYTVVPACVDFPGAELVEITGRWQVTDQVAVIATPGHSPGHQSLVVTGTSEGTVLLAGQAFDSASEFAAAAIAHQLGAEADDVVAPDWMSDLLHEPIDIARFAHDMAQWRPSAVSYRGSTRRRAWPG